MTIKEIKELIYINNIDIIVIIHSVSKDDYIKRYRNYKDFIEDKEINKLIISDEIINYNIHSITIDKMFMHIYIK